MKINTIPTKSYRLFALVITVVMMNLTSCNSVPADTESVNEECVSAPNFSETSDEKATSTDVESASGSEAELDTEEVSNEELENTSDDLSEHKHEFVKVSEILPNCESGGYTVYECECGEEERREEVEALGHEEGEWVVKSVASTICTGIEHLYCTRCNELLDEKVIPMLPDEDKESSEVEPETSEHEHFDYATKTVVEPTCTEKGYTRYECSCGIDEKSDYVAALGHNYGEWKVTKEATTTAEGEKTKTCSRCSNKVTESIPKIEEKTSSEPEVSDDPYEVYATLENLDLLEERIAYYINQHRASEGTAPLEFIDEGKAADFARGRAIQLTTNYAHDTADCRELATQLQFGDYVPPHEESYYDFEKDEVVYTGNMTEPYYEPAGGEAIAKKVFPNAKVDSLAYVMAYAWYESKAHWDYVGSPNNKYVSVGAYALDNEAWFFCVNVMLTDEYN